MHGGRSRGNQIQHPEFSLTEDPPDARASPSHQLWPHLSKYVPRTRKLTRDSVSRAFIRGWSHRQPGGGGESRYNRIPEGEHMFSNNPITYTQSLEIVAYSYQSWEWWEPSPKTSSQTPAKSQSYQQAFWMLAVKPATLSFCCSFVFIVYLCTRQQESSWEYLFLKWANWGLAR